MNRPTRPETGPGVEVPPPLPAGEAPEPMTREWVAAFPASAAYIINKLAKQVDELTAAAPTPATAEAPPLPESHRSFWTKVPGGARESQPYYTADQMRERDAMWMAREASRDNAWVLAMAQALGTDSGFSVPIAPSVEAFRALLDQVRAAARASTSEELRKAMLKAIAALESATSTRLPPKLHRAVIEGLRIQLAALSPTTPAAAQPAQQGVEPPLSGRWHHGEGFVCSGSLRIMRADFDTNPSEEFQQRLLDWVCETLTAAQRAASTQHQQDGGAA